MQCQWMSNGNKYYGEIESGGQNLGDEMRCVAAVWSRVSGEHMQKGLVACAKG